jgi:hypothetical protein
LTCPTTIGFWVAVNEFVEMASGRVPVTGGAAQVAREAVTIFNRYITAGSEFQVALPLQLVARIKSSLSPHMRLRPLPVIPPSMMMTPREVLPTTSPSAVTNSRTIESSLPIGSPRRAFGTFKNTNNTNGSNTTVNNSGIGSGRELDLMRVMAAALPPVSPDLFIDAQRMVYNTMCKDIWPRYIRSPLFAELLSATLAMPPPGTTHSAAILNGSSMISAATARGRHLRKRSEPYSDQKRIGSRNNHNDRHGNHNHGATMLNDGDNGHIGGHHSHNRHHNHHEMMSLQSSTSSPSVTEIRPSPPVHQSVPPIAGLAGLLSSSSSPSGASMGSLGPASPNAPLHINAPHHVTTITGTTTTTRTTTTTSGATRSGASSPVVIPMLPLRSVGGATVHFASHSSMRSPSPRTILSATQAMHDAVHDLTPTRHTRSTSGGLASDHNRHKRVSRRQGGVMHQRLLSHPPPSTVTSPNGGNNNNNNNNSRSSVHVPPPIVIPTTQVYVPPPLSPQIALTLPGGVASSGAAGGGGGHGGVGRLFQTALDIGLLREGDDTDPEGSPEVSPVRGGHGPFSPAAIAASVVNQHNHINSPNNSNSHTSTSIPTLSPHQNSTILLVNNNNSHNKMSNNVHNNNNNNNNNVVRLSSPPRSPLEQSLSPILTHSTLLGNNNNHNSSMIPMSLPASAAVISGATVAKIDQPHRHDPARAHATAALFMAMGLDERPSTGGTHRSVDPAIAYSSNRHSLTLHHSSGHNTTDGVAIPSYPRMILTTSNSGGGEAEGGGTEDTSQNATLATRRNNELHPLPLPLVMDVHQSYTPTMNTPTHSNGYSPAHHQAYHDGHGMLHMPSVAAANASNVSHHDHDHDQHAAASGGIMVMDHDGDGDGDGASRADTSMAMTNMSHGVFNDVGLVHQTSSVVSYEHDSPRPHDHIAT